METKAQIYAFLFHRNYAHQNPTHRHHNFLSNIFLHKIHTLLSFLLEGMNMNDEFFLL